MLRQHELRARVRAVSHALSVVSISAVGLGLFVALAAPSPAAATSCAARPERAASQDTRASNEAVGTTPAVAACGEAPRRSMPAPSESPDPFEQDTDDDDSGGDADDGLPSHAEDRSLRAPRCTAALTPNPSRRPTQVHIDREPRPPRA